VRVAITHTTRVDYDADVVEGVMDTHLGPRSDADQVWDRFDLVVQPSAAVRGYTDGFENAAHLITVRRPHRSLEIVARSEVRTLLDDPFRLPSAPPAPLAPSERWDYLAPSRLVQASDSLAHLAEPHRPHEPSDTLAAVRALTEYIYAEFRYEQNSTTVATTVDEVLRGRHGVCQDFAHLLIGLCRALEIPARYVSGYIVLDTGPAQSQTMGDLSQSQSLGGGPRRGAGASHAWVEAFTPTHGWRGFDPTNNLLASEHHVKMAIGRDYADVPPTRGTARGGNEEHLTVEVTTRLLD
jgi:transglutaminase-like putative cysteine protease